MISSNGLATRDGIKADINAACAEAGIPVEWLQEWHVRIGGVLDVYTKSHRWHNLKTGERGDVTGWISTWVRNKLRDFKAVE